MSRAYYNENDPFAAAWLRDLIKDGLIAPGDVDERSIEDVTPNDLTPYTQHHFFAGIGGWSYALRLAGWPDDRPVWTGSAPCQPFSSAGTGGGFADKRHLWPAWFWLIRNCQPATIFGEQVSSKAGLGWWDVVASDLEAAGYGCGAFDLCAAGAGAFHIRQRLYWVAHTSIEGIGQIPTGSGRQKRNGTTDAIGRGGLGGMVDAQTTERRGAERTQNTGRRIEEARGSSNRVGVALGDTSSTGLEKRPGQPGNAGEEQSAVERAGGGALDDTKGYGRSVWHPKDNRTSDAPLNSPSDAGDSAAHRRGPSIGGFWSGAEWILCRDGKARPVEPTIQPLAHGVPNRVGTLRGAGNAIVPELAAEFIASYMEIQA